MLQETPPDPSLALVSTCVWLAQSFMSVLTGAPAFPSEAEKNHVLVVGDAFQKTYVALCHQDSCWTMHPKFHLLTHMVSFAATRRGGRNPAQDSCWMDEDWLRGISRIAKRCHKTTVQLTLVQRYLLCLRQKLRENEL